MTQVPFRSLLLLLTLLFSIGLKQSSRAQQPGTSTSVANAPGTKEFTVPSLSESRMIIGKVFEKLMQAENEALSAKAQRRAALNNDNCRSC